MAKQVPNKSHAAEPVAAALQRSSQPLADLTAAQLALWRGGADFVRVLLRTQQNQMLSLWRVQAMALGNGQPPTLAPAASSLTPVLTSIGAAARLSEAALNMHRQMLAALLVRDL
jgi:hypothetical protein